jgi:hypothetical protein
MLVIIACSLVSAYGYYRLSLPNCPNAPEACEAARANTMSVFYIMTPIVWIIALANWWRSSKSK